MNRLSTAIEVASSNPVTVLFFLFLSIIYLFIVIINNNFQTIWAAEYRFNDSKQCITYEVMHSVASLNCVSVFDNVPFDGHFVLMLKLFSNNA